MKRKKFLHNLRVRQKTRNDTSPMQSMWTKLCATHLTIIFLYFQLSSITCLATRNECPSNHLLKSLVYHEDHTKIDCYCTYDPSHEREGGGWDISCLKQQLRSISNSKQVGNVTNDYSNPESMIKNNRHLSDEDDVPSDLHYSTLESTPFEFTIKHESRRAIEISCYDSSPDFKPAMFQGAYFIHEKSLSFFYFP